MGALKVRVGGAWVDVGSGIDEVYIGTDDPIATNPTAELWYDSDAPSTTFPPSYGLEAAKPATPAAPGTRYFATDTKREWLWDGTGWIVMAEPEQTYTPTLGGVTLGTPGQSNVGRFRRSNGMITLHTAFTLGTGGSWSGTATVSFPAGITAGTSTNGMIGAWLYDASTAAQYQGVGEASGGIIYPRASSIGGAYVGSAYAHASSPMVWAAGDGLVFFGTIPMGTRYQ